ncbi:MAG: glycosyltransferase family 2 protein [Sedimentisphaerales bacterium]|nr:glycosyltransferase family 2 protein [Sedimentisphaerales bacterium]
MIIAYYVFAAIILFVQTVVLLAAYRNVVYTLRTYKPLSDVKYSPHAVLISPCKGIDTTFDRNIAALFEQDYGDYEIYFVVESEQDPAYVRLKQIIADYESRNHRVKARLFVAGLSQTCVQKVHNLLCAIDATDEKVEVLAFVDSDACPKPHFLHSLIHPLRRQDVGASTGHRWFVPTDKRLASQVLSAMNALFASLLGPHGWNSAWGGAMAIRREVFEKTNIRKLWTNSATDDYTLTRAVKDADLEMIFVPACFVASYETTTFAQMFAFARRQFLITRVCMPQLWHLAFLGLGQFLLGFWIGAIVTIALWAIGSPHAIYAAILPAGLALHSSIKALTRQILIRRILPQDKRQLLRPAIIDIFFGPVLHLFTLTCLIASALSRTVHWRGIRYIFHHLTHTEIQRGSKVS